MRFKIDKEGIKKNLFLKDTFRHKPGKVIKLFPFIANATSLREEEVKLALIDFKGVAGACFREAMGLSQNVDFDKDKFIAVVCEKAGAPGDPNLKNILESVAFDEQGQLVLFDVLVYPHIRHSKFNPTLTNIAKCLYSVFFDFNEQQNLKSLANKDPDNLLYKLILLCLPADEKEENVHESYVAASQKTKQLFKKDLQTLLSQPDLFVNSFHQLLKFYFFRYITDLTIELNSFFDQPTDKLFFSVQWEKLQDFRLPITNGWKMFENHVEKIFSHAVNLEMINYIDGFQDGPLTYQEIFAQLALIGQDEQEELKGALNELKEMYREGINDVTWGNFSSSELADNGSTVESAIIELFEMIEFQFAQSNRERAKEAYQQWMIDFTNFNFSRKRGKLGLSLALNQEQLLLLTRLCVGNHDRIRLNQLWEELEQRGVRFDNVSREHVLSYYEKINLLEKKSDSGDAQYISKFNPTML